MVRKFLAIAMCSTLVLSGCSTDIPASSFTPTTTPATVITPTTSAQAIKHVLVIFGENISFDHYFGTYPNAANLPGEPAFPAASGTPTNISNYNATPALLTANPNLSAVNGARATNPYRLARTQAGTADQGHNYAPEQTAFDNGKMDMFPLSVGTADTAFCRSTTRSMAAGASCQKSAPSPTCTAPACLQKMTATHSTGLPAATHAPATTRCGRMPPRFGITITPWA